MQSAHHYLHVSVSMRITYYYYHHQSPEWQSHDQESNHTDEIFTLITMGGAGVHGVCSLHTQTVKSYTSPQQVPSPETLDTGGRGLFTFIYKDVCRYLLIVYYNMI